MSARRWARIERSPFARLDEEQRRDPESVLQPVRQGSLAFRSAGGDFGRRSSGIGGERRLLRRLARDCRNGHAGSHFSASSPARMGHTFRFKA